MTQSNSSTGKKDTLGGMIFTQFIAFVGCIVFPALVTAIAPVSWVKFERQGESVRCQSKTCLLFVIPYKSFEAQPVIGIGDRFLAGTESVRRRPGPDKKTKSEDEGFLVVHTQDASFEVPVTPFNLKSVAQQAKDFLDNPQLTQLNLFVVANWKFSVIAGGLVSLLTVLYVVGVSLAILTFPFRWLRNRASAL